MHDQAGGKTTSPPRGLSAGLKVIPRLTATVFPGTKCLHAYG
jgi:hypothetical protein